MGNVDLLARVRGFQDGRYALVLLAVCLWAGGGSALEFTNAIIRPDGWFQAQVLAHAGESLTIETSSDLVNWQPDACFTNVADQVTFVATPSVGHTAQRFYRARLGTAVLQHFSFVFYSVGGYQCCPATNFVPPFFLECLPCLSVENDSNYPAATNVLFTAPDGLSTTAFEDLYGLNCLGPIGLSGRSYKTGRSTAPTTGGVWTVNYKGTNLMFDVPDPQFASRSVIPFPTLSLLTNVIVNWVYRDATTGIDLPRAPAFITQVQFFLGGCSYASPVLPPDVTSVTTSLHGWDGRNPLDIVMAYRDDLGNTYMVEFGGMGP